LRIKSRIMDASSEMEMNLEDGRFGLNLGLQKGEQ
jgi:hypothetical protein